jgi:thiol-disulfide isomerase/thioredoxin
MTQRLLCKLFLTIFGIAFSSSSHVQAKEISKVIDLTTSNFDEQTREGLWLLEFYAPWCGHCKKLAPLWDDLSISQSASKLGKIDIPANEALASKYNITKFPTLKYAKDGRIGKYVGPRTRGLNRAIILFYPRSSLIILYSEIYYRGISCIFDADVRLVRASSNINTSASFL